MLHDYAMAPRTAMRRHDREVQDEEWIRAMLLRSPVATFAAANDGQPFINANLFLYDRERHAIYFHTAHAGRFRMAVEANPRVCMSLFTMGRILPAPRARNFSVEYEGVVLFGTVVVVAEEPENASALHALVAKYAPHLVLDRDYSGVTAGDLRDTALYRLDIEEWSGKRKSAPPDAEGAFSFDGIVEHVWPSEAVTGKEESPQ